MPRMAATNLAVALIIISVGFASRAQAGDQTAPPKVSKKTQKQTHKPGAQQRHSRVRHQTAQGEVANPAAVRATNSDELVYGDPVRYHNLSLVPVGTRMPGPFQEYTLLEAGLSAKTLAVRELAGQSGRAQVDTVEVRNSGKLPVYLLGGEMILGGKQDRVIQRDTVLDPKGGWTRVAVFCVEQNRWRGRNMEFRSAGALAHTRLHRALLAKSQGKVWQEVARKNLAHGTQSRTGTYRRTIQNAKLRTRIAPYRRQLLAMLPQGMQLAGVIFAVNGRIRLADIFGNPHLFDKLRDKLISAYILEALEEQARPNSPALSKAKAKRWLRKARKAQKVREGKSGRAVNYAKETDNAIGSETVDQQSGKRVRETYIMKQGKQAE